MPFTLKRIKIVTQNGRFSSSNLLQTKINKSITGCYIKTLVLHMFSQLFWLLGGFALGLFYTNSFHQVQCPNGNTNLQHRSTQSGILKFGNPGNYYP